MENIEFINDAGLDRWKDVVRLTGEIEDWDLSDDDWHWWKNGFGPSNFNLLIAVDKKTSQTVGSITSSYYEPIDGSEPLMIIGMFFVHPDYRGIGLGLQLFNRVVDDPRFKDINWGLKSVPEMTKRYASKFGYNKYTDWRVGAFKIPIKNMDPSTLEKIKEITIADAKDVEIEKIVKYDFNFQGKRVRRDGALKFLFREDNYFKKVALDKDGEVVGYGIIRKTFNNQITAGPMYAETPEIAGTLLREILESIPNLKSEYTNLWFFPADTNKGAIELIQKLSGGKVIEFEAWYEQFTKSAVPTDGNKTFSVME
ncbi:hypothetical protein FO519_009449 [Halicephalobus sp. NKZ332]|nr:hypothetical protein FO519_009449 [Halicephalobus sp. NKZ332]